MLKNIRNVACSAAIIFTLITAGLFTTTETSKAMASTQDLMLTYVRLGSTNSYQVTVFNNGADSVYGITLEMAGGNMVYIPQIMNGARLTYTLQSMDPGIGSGSTVTLRDNSTSAVITQLSLV